MNRLVSLAFEAVSAALALVVFAAILLLLVPVGLLVAAHRWLVALALPTAPALDRRP